MHLYIYYFTIILNYSVTCLVCIIYIRATAVCSPWRERALKDVCPLIDHIMYNTY